MSGLYLQPSKSRSNDGSLPSAPDTGIDVSALINDLINRIDTAERKLELKVDSNSLAKILLTDKDVVIQGDQVNVLGQLNIADWVRDVSGNPTGGIDFSSLTRIVGGKIQTGKIESFNWSVGAGSQIDLDVGTIVIGGTDMPKFSVSSSGVLTCQDAIVRGTVTAGSFIDSSVHLDDLSGPTIGDIAAGVDIQAALDAGVTNIVAGVGSNFRLDVDVANAYAVFRHKDAVFLGTALSGSNKVGLGISAGGIAMGYNQASNGAWQTKISIDSSGNVALTGTLTAGSIITNSVTVDGVTLSTISSRALSGYNIQQALEVSGTTILKGVLVPTDTGALKVGSITWNSTTGALTGGTGIAVTEFGIIGASSGSATFTLNASTGAASFKGDITGASNINITGNGRFDGVTTSPFGNAAVMVNNSQGALHGLVAYGNSGLGGTGVIAIGTGLANALTINGRMTIDNSFLVTNLNAQKWNGFTTGSVTTGSATATFNSTNKPGSNSTNSWWVVSDGSTTLRIPCWLT